MHKCIMLVFWNSREHTYISMMFFCWHYELSLAHTLGPSSLLLNRATRPAAWLTHTNQPTQTCQQPFKMSHTHTFFFSPWDTHAPDSRKLCQDHVRLGRHTWTRAATGLTLWAGEYTLKIMFAFTRANHLREQHHTLPTTHHFTSSHCFHHICQSLSDGSFFTRGLL